MVTDKIIHALIDNELSERERINALKLIQADPRAYKKYKDQLYQKHLLKLWWANKKVKETNND